jgi:hypothetical protein
MVIAMMLAACGGSPDTAEQESDPTHVPASLASQQQLGVSRWDVHDAPHTITGYDAEDNAAIVLVHEGIDQGATVLHRFGLREHANQAETQVTFPKDAAPEDPVQILAHRVSAGFDPNGVLERMNDDLGTKQASKSLSTAALGAGSIGPKGGGSIDDPTTCHESASALTKCLEGLGLTCIPGAGGEPHCFDPNNRAAGQIVVTTVCLTDVCTPQVIAQSSGSLNCKTKADPNHSCDP